MHDWLRPEIRADLSQFDFAKYICIHISEVRQANITDRHVLLETLVQMSWSSFVTYDKVINAQRLPYLEKENVDFSNFNSVSF